MILVRLKGVESFLELGFVLALTSGELFKHYLELQAYEKLWSVFAILNIKVTVLLILCCHHLCHVEKLGSCFLLVVLVVEQHSLN